MFTKNDASYIIKCAIVFFLLFGFGHIPPIPPLTPMGMQIIGIFAGVLFGWISVSIGWPSIMGLVVLGMTDFFNMGHLFATAFGSQAFIMFLGLLLLSAFVQQAELTDLILETLLNLKSARGRPFATLFYFLLAGFLASLLSQCIAVLIIFLELFKSMMRQTGIKPYSSAVSCFFIGMVFSFCLGDMALPFKTTSIVGIGAYEAAMGAPMNLVSYTLFSLPFSLFLIVSYVLLVKYVFKCDLSALAAYTPPPLDSSHVTLRKKVSLIAVIAALLLLLLPNILPESWAISGIIKAMGLGGLTMTIIGLLLVIRVNEEPIMDLQKLAGNLPWNVMFMLAFLLPVAGAIASDKAGLKAILMDSSMALLQGMPPFLTVAVIILLAGIVTNFANNLVVAGIFITIICMLSGAISLNPALVSTLIIFASCLAIFFPAACPTSAIVFSQKDLVSFHQLTSLGLKIFIAEFLLIAFVGYFAAQLFF